MQELLRYGDDGTVEVRKWVSDIQWNSFHGWAKVCREGELENEDMPEWTRKAVARICQDVLADVETRNTHVNSTMWKSTDFLKHVAKEKEGRGAIAFHVRL